MDPESEMDLLEHPLPSFFGLVVEPKKPQELEVEASFKVSQAALGNPLPQGASRTSLVVTVDGTKFVLCNLIPGVIEQFPLDHLFQAGEEVSFSVVGNCPIHLTGYDMPHDHSHGDDFSEEDFSEDDFDDEELEEEEEVPKPAASKKRNAEEQAPAASKKQAIEGKDNKPQQKKVEQKKPEEKKPEQKKPEQKKPEQKKPEEKKAEQKKAEQKKPEEKKAEEKKGGKKTFPNGLITEDLKVGDGKVAKSGAKVAVRYTGRLASNGSIFDSNTQGPPFSFNLGRGEVIKGWDIGVEGMAVGGERKITIPAPLAYGARGAPPQIPKNATLTFVVKLLDVKK